MKKIVIVFVITAQLLAILFSGCFSSNDNEIEDEDNMEIEGQFLLFQIESEFDITKLNESAPMLQQINFCGNSNYEYSEKNKTLSLDHNAKCSIEGGYQEILFIGNGVEKNINNLSAILLSGTTKPDSDHDCKSGAIAYFELPISVSRYTTNKSYHFTLEIDKQSNLKLNGSDVIPPNSESIIEFRYYCIFNKYNSDVKKYYDYPYEITETITIYNHGLIDKSNITYGNPYRHIID